MVTRTYVNAHMSDMPAVLGVNTAVPALSGERYSIGGVIGGITGSVVLTNNADTLIIRPGEPGTFAFPTKLSVGEVYAVQVATPPAGQQCFMRPGKTGSGVVEHADITDIHIQCSSLRGWNPFIPLAIGGSSLVSTLGLTPQHTIGGTVSGLSGTVVLQNNIGVSLSVSSNGPFTFTPALNEGSPYAVSVLTQPDQQNCTVSNAIGTLGASNVTNVNVSCVSTLPTVSSLTPTNGLDSGGTFVTIHGSNFTNATAVRFGATLASFFVINSTTITATAPAHSVGVVDVTVTTPAGTSATSSADQFTYFNLSEAFHAVPFWSHRFAGGISAYIGV